MESSHEAECQEIAKKLKRKNLGKSAYRGDMYNSDVSYHSYAKKTKKLRPNELKKKTKQKRIDILSKYVEKEDMKRTLLREKERWKKEKAVVGGISTKNDVYNERLGRAYDKYTTEIQENLERGTAL